jgi:hypothetical protein
MINISKRQIFIYTFQQLSVHELDEPQDWVEINVVDKDER